jgi:hypothetical protein
MADNIKIVGDILNIDTISRYLPEDINLINSKKLQENFGGKDDYIEYFVYDVGENLLNFNFNYIDYKLPSFSSLSPGTSTLPNTTGNIQTTNVGIDSTLATLTSSLYPIIEIDPIKDLENLGYSTGEFKVQYNFFQNKISDFLNQDLFVKEISQDRTEIRLASTTLTNEKIEIQSSLTRLKQMIEYLIYHKFFVKNFMSDEEFIQQNETIRNQIYGF